MRSIVKRYCDDHFVVHNIFMTSVSNLVKEIALRDLTVIQLTLWPHKLGILSLTLSLKCNTGTQSERLGSLGTSCLRP